MADWIAKGYAIDESVEPKRTPFILTAGSVTHVPAEDFIFKAKEGALVIFSGAFDDPSCGIKVEAGLQGGNVYDSRNVYTVLNYMIGSSPYDPNVYVNVPPTTPPGLYFIKKSSREIWFDWLRLSLINTDSSPHYCIGYGYDVFLATTQRS